MEQGTTNDMDEGKKRHPPAAELLNQIRGTIRASNRALYMNFEGVDPESGSFIAKAIDLDAEMDGRLYRYAAYLLLLTYLPATKPLSPINLTISQCCV